MLPPVQAAALSVLSVVGFVGSAAYAPSDPAVPSAAYLDSLRALPFGWIVAVGAAIAAVIGVILLTAFRRPRGSSTPRELPVIRVEAEVDRDRRLVAKYGTAGLLSAGFGGLGVWQSGSGSPGDGGFDVGHLSDQVAPCFNNSPLGPPCSQPLFIPPALAPTRVAGTDDIYIYNTNGGLLSVSLTEGVEDATEGS